MVKEINFEILDSAAKQIEKIVKNEKANTYLRIEILGGGCAGFSYKIDLDTNINDDDIVLSKDNIKSFNKQSFIPYLDGSTIEFADELIGKSFKINNPNATSSCGCGTSFSV